MSAVVLPLDPASPLSGLALEQVDAKSRTDRVYHQMRDRLMRGIFKPHQRLRISELSQAFGTSETPIREAIFQLIRDGAVEAKPHSYYRVRKLSVAEYMERREIRLLLEPLAARRALERITDAEVETLAATHDRLVVAEATKDYVVAVRANFEFHFGLYRCSAMPQLINLLENLWIQHGPMLNHLYPHGHPTYEGKHQHVNVVDALRRRDEAALVTAVEQDLIEGGRAFLHHLQELEAQEQAEAKP
jgi:DNA-binding GntR family transcriptional regulator